MPRPKRILAQTLKELTQLGRDRLTLALALLLPLILLLLFGFAISLDVNTINLAIQDLDQSPMSREYIATFQRTRQFRLVEQAPNLDIPQLLDRGTVSAGVVIPPEFSRNLQRPGRAAQVQVIVDGTDANTANLVRGYARATTQAFQASLQGQARPRVEAAARLWYNPGLKTLTAIGPGAITLALTLFPPLLAGLATARELEQGTILPVYASSLSGSEYLLGKALAFWLVGMVEVLLVNLAAWVCFGLWFAGDPTPLMVGSLFYIACGVCWGIFLGTVTGAQSAVILAVTISAFLLSLLMSGFIYPVANIPAGLRWFAHFVPAQAYMPLARDAFARGMGWPQSWPAVLTLAGLAGFFFVIAWRRLQRMQVNP